MPLRFVKVCKACQAVRKDPKLLKRIYASKYYQKGGEPLSRISEEKVLHYRGLLNHVQYHQQMSDDALAEAQVGKIAKKAEKEHIQKFVRTADARQEVIDKLNDKLSNLNLDEMSARDVVSLLLKGAKDADDVAAKRKDQDIDIMKMMAGARSGEVQDTSTGELYDPWAEQQVIDMREVVATELANGMYIAADDPDAE